DPINAQPNPRCRQSDTRPVDTERTTSPGVGSLEYLQAGICERATGNTVTKMPDPDYAPKIVRLVGSPRPRRVPGLGSRILAIYWVAMVVWLVITRSFSWLLLIVG